MSAEGVMVVAVFVQVALTFWSIVSMGFARIEVLKRKEVLMADIALSNDAYPEHIQKLQNNARNQFELPVLFFACVCLTVGMDLTNWVIAVCSVVFAMSRLVHRHIHVGGNHLRHRFRAYAVGLVAVFLMWIGLAYEMWLG